MSRLIAKILLAMLMFPLAGLLNLVVYMIVENYSFGDNESIIIAAGITWLFMIVYWTALWFRSTQWTGGRIMKTAAVTAGAVIAGSIVAVAMQSTDRSVGYFSACHTTSLLWIAGTIFAWRESAAERTARLGRTTAATLVCPTCGYNLTGLSEARCPECGTRFTIDELIAAQPDRAASVVEIES